MKAYHPPLLLAILICPLLSCNPSRTSNNVSSTSSAAQENSWHSLFNHKNLNGWEAVGGGRWEVTKGIIVGASLATERLHGILISDKKYSDFKLKVIYKSVRGNSGVYFRVDKVNHPAQVFGLQAEIDPDKDDGGLYETGGREWVVQPTEENVIKWYRPNKWNEMVIVAKGKDVTVYLNGYKTAEIKEDPGRGEGYIGLQLHARMEMKVLFKDILIIENPQNMRL